MTERGVTNGDFKITSRIHTVMKVEDFPRTQAEVMSITLTAYADVRIGMETARGMIAQSFRRPVAKPNETYTFDSQNERIAFNLMDIITAVVNDAQAKLGNPQGNVELIHPVFLAIQVEVRDDKLCYDEDSMGTSITRNIKSEKCKIEVKLQNVIPYQADTNEERVLKLLWQTNVEDKNKKDFGRVKFVSGWHMVIEYRSQSDPSQTHLSFRDSAYAEENIPPPFERKLSSEIHVAKSIMLGSETYVMRRINLIAIRSRAESEDFCSDTDSFVLKIVP